MLNFGLIGYPLGHSLSPSIHKAALEACGLEGDYSLFPIHPGDHQGLKELLARLCTGELAGLNVTIPHKQTVVPLLDDLTPTARAIGAVNTIYFQDGKLTGENTDMQGFLVDLQKFLTTNTAPKSAPRPEPPPAGGVPAGRGAGAVRGVRRREATKSVLILGAGGSARAVVYALAHNGWTVSIASRRPDQAQTLKDQLQITNSQGSAIEYHPTSLYSVISTLSLMINTTPLGMSPDIEASPWPTGLPFPPNAAVYDLVYNPRETRLVREARAAGLPATTGLGMLIEQAALSFEIWTGCAPPREALIASVP